MKFKIRISHEQYLRIKPICLSSDYRDRNNEIKCRLVGKVKIPPLMEEMTVMIFAEFPNILYLEGSLPKVVYGENVHLFYPNQLESFLQILYETLVFQFESFPDYAMWEVQRIDVCYAWDFTTPEEALKILKYAQSLEYLRKIKRIYPDESVDFIGGHTKVKFYLKAPEFKKHSYNDLVEKGYKKFADEILLLSSNVLRFEITYRRPALMAFFHENRSIRYERFLDEAVLLQMLNNAFPNFTANTDKEVVKLDLVLQALIAHYKVSKAIRLFCWYCTYIHSKLSTRNMIKKYANSSDISTNKRDLEKAGVYLPTMLDVAPFKFHIPSFLVVNPPIADAVVTAAADRILKILRRGRYPDQTNMIFIADLSQFM